MKDYPLINLQPGETKQFNSLADYVRIREISAGGALKVTGMSVKPLPAFSTVMLGGDDYDLQFKYEKWLVENVSNVAVTGVVVLGQGSGSSTKIVSDVGIVGDVSVIGDINALTRFDNLTVDGNRYFGGIDLPAGGADLFGQVAFFNPASSPVDVYIDVLRLCNYGSAVSFFKVLDADLASFGSINVNSKIIGGVSGNCLSAISNNSLAPYGSSLDASISTGLYGTATALDFKNSPIFLQPGFGINFVGVTNTKLTVFAEMYEVVR